MNRSIVIVLRKVLPIFGLFFVLSSCGSPPVKVVASLGKSTGSAGDLASSASGAGSTGKLSASSALKFSECMRSHGISNFPDPQVSGNSVRLLVQGGPTSDINPNSRIFQSAHKSCQKYIPAPSPSQVQQMQQAALANSQCMRTHGFPNFPDPQFLGNGGVKVAIPSNSGIDQNSPQFQAAQKACGIGKSLGFRIGG